MDIEDAIYFGLIEGESTYNKLFHRIQKYKECALATFDKHLKNMVESGIVNRKAGKKKGQHTTYWIDPEVSTLARKLGITTEKTTSKWDKDIEKLQSYVNAYKDVPEHEIKILGRVLPVIFERFVNSIVAWYEFSAALSFLGASGFLPKVTEKQIKKVHKVQSEKIEGILYKMKEIDPLMHNKFCVRMASKLTKT